MVGVVQRAVRAGRRGVRERGGAAARAGAPAGLLSHVAVSSEWSACRYSVRTVIRSCLVAGMVAVRVKSSRARSVS